MVGVRAEGEGACRRVFLPEVHEHMMDLCNGHRLQHFRRGGIACVCGEGRAGDT